MVSTIRDTDIGTEFKVTMTEILEAGDIAIFDISSFTTVEIEFLENNGTTVTAESAATFKTDGTDGVITWTTPDTTLLAGKSGQWHYRGHVAKTGADFRNFNWIPFTVKKTTE